MNIKNIYLLLVAVLGMQAGAMPTAQTIHVQQKSISTRAVVNQFNKYIAEGKKDENSKQICAQEIKRVSEDLSKLIDLSHNALAHLLDIHTVQEKKLKKDPVTIKQSFLVKITQDNTLEKAVKDRFLTRYEKILGDALIPEISSLQELIYVDAPHILRVEDAWDTILIDLKLKNDDSCCVIL
jgi:hypothetical protein